MAKMVKYYNGSLVEYEILKLVDFYDDVLRKPTEPIKLESSADRKYADYVACSLAETMTKLRGLGLSANQVGIPYRVCAINLGSESWVLFNPEVLERSGNEANYPEGCLSYPGLYLNLKRPEHIKVKFQAINGQWVEQEFDGLTAVCVQHEIDHLDGKVYTEQVSPIKLEQAKRKVKTNLKKIKRFEAQEEMRVEQEKAVQQKQAEGKISILGGASNLLKKEPEKFVYNG